MTATAHALIGAALATRIPEPVVAIPVIVSSHFLLDAIPHWDVGTNWRERPKRVTAAFAIAETLFGMILASMLYYNRVAYPFLISAISASLLPDWLETPWYIFFAQQKKHGVDGKAGIGKKLAYWVYKQESKIHNKAQLPFGLITQVATVGILLILLS